MTNDEGRVRTRTLPSSRSWTFWLKVGIVAVIDALAVAAVPVLATDGAWALLALLTFSVLLINWAYLSPRASALKWLTPGLIPLALFVVWPVVYTAYVSVTNWATGNVLAKDQVIEQLEGEVIRSPGGGSLDLTVFRDGTGTIAFYLQASDGSIYFGVPRQRSEEPVEAPLLDVDALGATDADGDGIPETIGGFEALGALQVTGLAAQGLLEDAVLDVPGGVAEVQTTKSARLVLAGQRYSYDVATDSVTDALEGVTCPAVEGNFVCPDGRRIDPGWRILIGTENYTSIFTNPRIRGPFTEVFIWNLAFAGLSVLLTFIFGLTLANALQDDRVRGKFFYRSIFIIPYAIPAFLSALVWRGLLQAEYGQVNKLLGSVGIDAVPWLTDGTWAKVAVLVVNLWLGFPYMFLLTTGALQAIPTELKEAARVDGAGPFRVFRTVTLPLLLVTTAPLLIGSFAFNFNNFVLIYLLTQGGPPVAGAAVPYGKTDILISFTFDLAVRSGRGQNFALASAIVVMIFVLVAAISAFSFRFTRRLEEVYGNV